MSMVLVATTAQIVKSGFLDPSAVFLPSVAIIFIVTGLLHPNEMSNLITWFSLSYYNTWWLSSSCYLCIM